MAFFKEIIQYILKTRGSPISWNSISKNTSINTPNTIISYIDIIEKMYLIKPLYLLNAQNIIEYRKNKKVHVTDPFLLRLFSNYTGVKILDEHIVESVVATHFSRKYPTYYWKNGTEVDVITVIEGITMGFEVKFGVKDSRKALHLKKQYVLDANSIPLFLATTKWS
jgi:hypothetical protein